MVALKTATLMSTFVLANVGFRGWKTKGKPWEFFFFCSADRLEPKDTNLNDLFGCFDAVGKILPSREQSHITSIPPWEVGKSSFLKLVPAIRGYVMVPWRASPFQRLGSVFHLHVILVAKKPLPFTTHA